MLKYYDELVYYVQKMTKDKEQALEIVQETYAKALEKQKEITIENERAFLYAVARNLSFDLLRKIKNKEFIEYQDDKCFSIDEQQPDEILLEINKEELLLEALDTLPHHLKQVFVLHIFDGYDKKQISKILNLDIRTVQKYVITATAILTEYIEKKEWN